MAKLIEPILLVLRNAEKVYSGSIDPPRLAIAKSGFPSPSRSPMAIEMGFEPVAKSTFVAKFNIPALLVLRNTETVLVTLVITKSSLPSPSISPMANERGPEPVGKSAFKAKFA